MAAPRPQEQRDLATVWFSLTPAEVARRLNISRSCAIKWKKRFDEAGFVYAKKFGGHCKPKLTGQEEFLCDLVEENPTITTAEVGDKLAEKGIHVSCETVRKTLKDLDLSFKKASKFAMQRLEEAVRDYRAAWFNIIREYSLSRLNFLDETCVKNNMHRERGWGPRGERVECPVPYGSYIKWTLVGALSLKGAKGMRMFSGSMTSAKFFEYTRDVLIRELRRGDVLVMDNLRAHKNPEALALLQAKGIHVLFLPPYSPDFNPIEFLWSPVKHLLRTEMPKTFEEVWDCIVRAVKKFGMDTILKCFAHAGYVST